MPEAAPLARAYGLLFRAVLIRLPPETAHHLAMLAIRLLGAVPAPPRRPGRGPIRVMGLEFPSAFGLAAGFDKNAVAVRGLGRLGFGHVEVGTVTHLPQPGNPRPRLFRLPADRALINRMGFNNDGAAAVAARLARLRRRGGLPVVGVNIGKSRAVPVASATADYVASTRLLGPVADYLVVNVSSPNTPGLRGLQDVHLLEPLLSAVQDAAAGVPLLVKIAPDMTDRAVREIAELVARLGLAGVVATNTTVERAGLASSSDVVAAAGAGGLSGPPVAARASEVLTVLRATLPGDRCVISVGGVESRAHASSRLDAGADLVQGYTAFLYRGPGWAAELASAG